MQRLALVIVVVMVLSNAADASSRLLMQTPTVTATLSLSRAGKTDRCVASLTLRGADGKPLPAAAAAHMQWTGDTVPQAVSTSPKNPGRLLATSSSQAAAAVNGCEVQVLEVTVAGVPVTLAATSVTRRSITW